MAIECQWCGEVLDDFDEEYCDECREGAERRAKHQNKLAKISKWVKVAKTKQAEEAAQLTYELIHQLGGIEKTAQAIVEYMKETENRDHGERHRLFGMILKMIELTLPVKRTKWKYGANPGGSKKQG
jgi:hypothetical protein